MWWNGQAVVDCLLALAFGDISAITTDPAHGWEPLGILKTFMLGCLNDASGRSTNRISSPSGGDLAASARTRNA